MKAGVALIAALLALPGCGGRQQKPNSGASPSPRTSEGPLTAIDVRYQLLSWAETIDPVIFATGNRETKDAKFSDVDLLKVGLSTTKPGDVFTPEIYVQVLGASKICYGYERNRNPSDHNTDAD